MLTAQEAQDLANKSVNNNPSIAEEHIDSLLNSINILIKNQAEIGHYRFILHNVNIRQEYKNATEGRVNLLPSGLAKTRTILVDKLTELGYSVNETNDMIVIDWSQKS
jgi:hypothetical protein